MKRHLFGVVVLVVAGAVLLAQAWATRVGEPAPNFTATDSHGQVHRLSDYAGKFVVLEWTNRECPSTRKHYDSGNMQRLQREWTQRGVVWLTVVSSAPGKLGYVTAEQENAHLTQVKASPTAVLLDPNGDLGRLYDAKTTPHMFVIDPKGTLLYNGAVDDHPTTDAADIPGARNYLSEALEEAMAGKAVRNAETRPYGCPVKYAQ
ncbi:MAG: redoxin domain-containing protein [Candidatus Acidiferrales bacterium]|jgi:peroxiredoxin